MRMIATSVPVAVCLALVVTVAEAGPRKTVSCQRNTEDGRILVDGREVGDARYRVIRYQVTRNEGLWTYGRCLIEFG